MKNKYLTFLLFAFLGMIFVIMSNTLIQNDPILTYDDKLLLTPLIEHSSVSSYVEAWQKGKIVDRQPIRDLSYLADIALKKVAPFWSFHLSNLLIGLLALYFFFRLAQFYIEDKFLLVSTTLILAFHPSLWLTLSWISGRKHLLSFCFILLATLSLHYFKSERKLKILFVSILSFFMALLSHPIAILWPFWGAYFLKNEKANIKTSFILPAFSLSALNAWTNLYYYQGLYLKQGAAPKIVSTFSFSESLLALGRYFYNAFLPFQVSPHYYPGSVQNLIGLALLTLFIYLLFKFLPRQKTVLWLSFIIFPLLPVIGMQQNVFVHDSYLLLTLVGVSILSALLIRELPFEKKRVLPILNILALLFLIQSYSVAQSFESENKLWERAWEIEETPFVLAQKANRELENKEFVSALQDVERLKNWNPDHPLLSLLYPKAVFFSPQLTQEEKEKRLRENYSGQAWQAYFLSALYAQKNDYHSAYEILKEQVSKCVDFENEAEVVAAELKYFCLKSKGLKCDELVQDFSSACQFRALTWHDAIVQKRLSELLR